MTSKACFRWLLPTFRDLDQGDFHGGWIECQNEVVPLEDGRRLRARGQRLHLIQDSLEPPVDQAVRVALGAVPHSQCPGPYLGPYDQKLEKGPLVLNRILLAVPLLQPTPSPV